MAQSIAANIWHRVAGPFTSQRTSNTPENTVGDIPEVGERFAQVSDGGPVWVVENILNVSASSHPLVRLTRENHPDLLKIISLSTLSDTDEFLPTN